MKRAPQALTDIIWSLHNSRARRLRTMRQFAEEEIVIPGGPFAGRRFRCARQPFTGLWFDEIDSNRWSQCVATGPRQTGKSLCCFVIPILYHLFEVGEKVICGLPDMDMAADKWREDLLPVIERSKYRDLMPKWGGGSRGGKVQTLQFLNGATLKFMSGGGGDKSRVGFESRVLVITETDGLDTAATTSRETDKIGQMQGCLSSWGDRGRTYMECTVSTPEGRTWREIKSGTDSKIVIPCPHCHAWVTPEREQLTGWQDAQTVVEAGQKAALCCPSCGAIWTEIERVAANAKARLVHRGQAIDAAGNVAGAAPGTHTLGFRWNAANNLLMSMARVAEEEWEAPRTTDADSAEKKLRQFFWTLPSEAESVTLSEMDAMSITRRSIDVPRGRVPADAAEITIGIDIGKWLSHWVAVAWRPGGSPHVAEYGRLEVPSREMSEEVAILSSLRTFRDGVCIPGWTPVGGDKNISPRLTLVDSGAWESTIVAFCVESGPGFLPSKGFGVQQLQRRNIYREPAYEPVMQPAGHYLIEVNADWWKSYVHNRLQTPPVQPGALTLFHASPSDHLTFAKHLTAERRVEEFVAGKGLVTRWEAVNRNNHYLDALALACVAGHGIGQRLVTATAVQAPAPQQQAAPVPQHDGGWLGDTSGWMKR
jgi:phage terminase large subunit GpA-like protein